MGDSTQHTSPEQADDQLHRRGLMFILSSPSGAGKTTLSRMLLARDPEIRLSVSATTRPPRPNEVDGVHYHFVTPEQFDQMVEEDDFYEWAHVFGHRYGTPKGLIRAGLKQGQDFLFDIDWQGTQQLAQAMEEDLVRIFILPPSAEELRERLIGRAQDSASTVARRMAKAADEISHWPEYDYVIVNDDIDVSDAEITAILRAERLRRRRRVGLTQFVRELTKNL